MAWNVQEFRTLCERHNIDDSSMYQETLDYKLIKSLRFSERSFHDWMLYLQEHGIEPNDPGLGEAEFESEANGIP